jgi:hypothetical protein
MVTVTQTPVGIKIIDQPISAIIVDFLGTALIQMPSHSLTNGDYVLIESDIDEYNGIWYVSLGNVDQFRISAGNGTGYVPYYQDADITYYQAQTHVWSSIFLPIIYKATNDLYPTNSDDSVVGVVSQADDNGYTQLTLSGVTGANALEYVILNDGTVHQVVELNPPTLTINLLYDASNVITTVQKYYNNYQIRVKIFAGLPPTEPWADHKPWTEVAELSLTPDADNNVMFSVSDYIKALVNVRNNPLLFSLPLNLDAFTGFYISTAEAYDSADGYSITRYESAFTDNSFEGYAVAGVLPFKNRYSGQYSEYVYTSGTPAKWLNTLTTVIGVVDRYFDVSFIKNIAGPFTLLIDKWANDYRYETEEVVYDDFGIGVYRLPLTFVSAYDQFCIRVQKPAVAERAASSVTMLFMENCPDGVWTEPSFPTTVSPSVTLVGSGGDSGYVSSGFISNVGIDHPFNYQITVNTAAASITIVHFALMDDDCNILAHEQVSHIASSTLLTGSFTLNPTLDGTRIGVRIVNSTIPAANRTYEVVLIDFEGTPGAAAADITEELCIDIYEVCGFDDAATIEPTGARRLLEDGGFRLLED